MKRFGTPWLARQAMLGLMMGVLGAAAALAILPARLPVRLLLALIVTVAGYLTGFAVAAALALGAATRYVLRLRAELRTCQDHIMSSGSSRSLGAYLEAAAGSIKGSLTALETEARSFSGDVALTDAARRIADHAAALRESLREVSGFALPEPARSPFNVNTLLREALDLCRHRAEERQIRFEERYAVVPPVFGPASRVQGALLNVIVNAVEAMPHSGGGIVVETSHVADRVVARVHDSGIGIRPEHLSKVFDPFFTTKPDKTSSGLGLWETRTALELIGATIQLRSVPHQGTEVIMSFPQAAPMSPGRAAEARSEDLGRNTADEGDRRIA